MMRSERWTAGLADTKVAVRGQPYILPSGHISGSALLTWRCTANQWFATTVRSVIQRISKRTVVTKRSKYKKKRDLTKIAILYVLTNNSNLLERLLNCHKSAFTRAITKEIMSVDAKTRFLYDQAVNAALWFELRGNPRVQSTKRTVREEYRIFGLKSYSTTSVRSMAVVELSVLWIV